MFGFEKFTVSKKVQILNNAKNKKEKEKRKMKKPKRKKNMCQPKHHAWCVASSPRRQEWSIGVPRERCLKDHHAERKASSLLGLLPNLLTTMHNHLHFTRLCLS
jgi:hypothetical protein